MKDLNLIQITHIGTATTVLQIGNIRILTDPAFDPRGTSYSWAPFGGNSTKLEDPAVSPDALGSFDAILITHAQHDDNLDASGRTLLSKAKRVITTQQSAKKLGGRAEGFSEWETTEIVGENGQRIRLTTTPARHGPPFSLPFVGKVIGFILEWEGQKYGSLYISGDTVLFNGIQKIGERFDISLALLHLGQAKLPIMGPFRLTMNGREAARAAHILRAQTVVPIHYDGWTHFSEPRDKAKQAFERAGLSNHVHWLPKGQPTEFEV